MAQRITVHKLSPLEKEVKQLTVKNQELELSNKSLRNTISELTSMVKPEVLLDGGVRNLNRLNDVIMLSPEYVRYIFDTFIEHSDGLYDVYSLTFNYKDINTMPDSVLEKLLDAGLIVIGVNKDDEKQVYYQRNALLSNRANGIYIFGSDKWTRPKLISDNMVNVLPDNYNFYHYDSRYWITSKDYALHVNIHQNGKFPNPYHGLPHEKGYEQLADKQVLSIGSPYEYSYDPNKIILTPLPSPVRVPISRKNVDPMLLSDVHDTKLTVADNYVLCHNIPSTYDRNYYVYVVHCYTPNSFLTFCV